MTDEEIAKRITTFIVDEVASSPVDGELAPDFPIIERGLVDSLGLFKVVAFMEDEFKVQVAPEEIVFENFETVNAIVDLVKGKQAAK